MDPTTEEGRGELREKLRDTAPADCTHRLFIAFLQALDHIENLEAERDELRAEVERLTRVVSYQRARIPAED